MTGGCPLADVCPRFEETIEGLGCQNHRSRAGVEWCESYGAPLYELREKPVLVDDVVEVETVRDHPLGSVAFIDGFVIIVSNASPDLRVRARVSRVFDLYAHADAIEVLGGVDPEPIEEPDRPPLGDRDNWWADEATGEPNNERRRGVRGRSVDRGGVLPAV